MQYPIAPGSHLAFPIGLLQAPKDRRDLEKTWRNLADKVEAAQLGEQLNDMAAEVIPGRHDLERLDGERQSRRFELRGRQHQIDEKPMLLMRKRLRLFQPFLAHGNHHAAKPTLRTPSAARCSDALRVRHELPNALLLRTSRQ
jgi:hypothetical protein